MPVRSAGLGNRGLPAGAACWRAPYCTTATNRASARACRLVIGLVRFDAGPVAVCLPPLIVAPGDDVQVRINADDLLEAA